MIPAPIATGNLVFLTTFDVAAAMMPMSMAYPAVKINSVGAFWNGTPLFGMRFFRATGSIPHDGCRTAWYATDWVASLTSIALLLVWVLVKLFKATSLTW